MPVFTERSTVEGNFAERKGPTNAKLKESKSDMIRLFGKLWGVNLRITNNWREVCSNTGSSFKSIPVQRLYCKRV